MRYILFINITDGYTFNCDDFVGITNDKDIATAWNDATCGDTFYLEIPDADNYLVPNIDKIAKENMAHESMVLDGYMNLPEAVSFIKELINGKTV